jgi:hypothetical protein
MLLLDIKEEFYVIVKLPIDALATEFLTREVVQILFYKAQVP